jgi:hypothetical protein
MIYVIGTTGTPPRGARGRWYESIQQGQVNLAWNYLELPDPHPDGFPHFPALIGAIEPLPDGTIVVSLDGDDYLLPNALERVHREHAAGALVTYGSFLYSDGRKPTWVHELRGPVRDVPWVTTHLKTFRAGLFKRIRHADLKSADGRWLEHARDMALMFPLVEMAGDRARYIPEPLMIYNYANSCEHRLGAPWVAAEQEEERRLRALPRYERIDHA